MFDIQQASSDGHANEAVHETARHRRICEGHVAEAVRIGGRRLGYGLCRRIAGCTGAGFGVCSDGRRSRIRGLNQFITIGTK